MEPPLYGIQDHSVTVSSNNRLHQHHRQNRHHHHHIQHYRELLAVVNRKRARHCASVTIQTLVDVVVPIDAGNAGRVDTVWMFDVRWYVTNTLVVVPNRRLLSGLVVGPQLV